MLNLFIKQGSDSNFNWINYPQAIRVDSPDTSQIFTFDSLYLQIAVNAVNDYGTGEVGFSRVYSRSEFFINRVTGVTVIR